MQASTAFRSQASREGRPRIASTQRTPANVVRDELLQPQERVEPLVRNLRSKAQQESQISIQ